MCGHSLSPVKSFNQSGKGTLGLTGFGSLGFSKEEGSGMGNLNTVASIITRAKVNTQNNFCIGGLLVCEFVPVMVCGLKCEVGEDPRNSVASRNLQHFIPRG